MSQITLSSKQERDQSAPKEYLLLVLCSLTFPQFCDFSESTLYFLVEIEPSAARRSSIDKGPADWPLQGIKSTMQIG